MKIFNTLTRTIEDLSPLKKGQVSLYSCGPTVYDHIHIGNLCSFIYVDTLQRTLKLQKYKVRHIMNFTDVDDKTIARSQSKYPDNEPMEALSALTSHYGEVFISDMKSVGNDIGSVKFVKATQNIDKIQALITKLFKDSFAYIAEDGVYFSIDAYKKNGKKYGQLQTVTVNSTAQHRIANDEYDKDNASDFALWKVQKNNEPAWEFELDGRNLLGRPGWHIECSAMSTAELGQPFDIHTGGVDLIFPHHENEIAQSTAGHDNPLLAKYFVHNEHLLVDGHKMSKSLNNFYTLRDIVEKGFDPIAFRVLVLQSHYRSQLNFTWDSLEAAQNRLSDLRAMADMVWQPVAKQSQAKSFEVMDKMVEVMGSDLASPKALAILGELAANVTSNGLSEEDITQFRDLLTYIDKLFGLGLSDRNNITPEQKTLIKERETARGLKHWEKSDEIRDALKNQGLTIKDTDLGPVWQRI